MEPIILKTFLLALFHGVFTEPILSLYLQPPNPYSPLQTHSTHPIVNSGSTELFQENYQKRVEVNPSNPVVIPPTNQISSDSNQHEVPHTDQESAYGQMNSYYKNPVEQNRNHPSHFQRNPNYHTLNPFQSQQNYVQPGNQYGPKQLKTIKYVSVFVAPPPLYNEEAPQRIQVKGAAEKHVNIIFIKNPSSKNSAVAEVDLPPSPEQKTVVYVLNEKQKGSTQVKVNTPHPPPHHKPDVFFVQYKNPKEHHEPAEYGGNNLGYSNPDQNDFNYYSSASSSQASTSQGRKTDSILSSYSSSNPIETTYAPSMTHDAYNVLSKREVSQGPKDNANNSASSDFRPYSYALNMDHGYYGVIGIKNNV